jgi:hypothetical protein
MKAVLCASLVFVPHAFADDAADRVAIGRAIAALNEPSHSTLFGDGGAEFERLRSIYPLAFQIIGPAAGPDHHPTVTISHEPWGEATINLSASRPSVAFITPDVALAEGACSYEDSHAERQTTPLLFAMKKVGDDWKIASIRVLAR